LTSNPIKTFNKKKSKSEKLNLKFIKMRSFAIFFIFAIAFSIIEAGTIEKVSDDGKASFQELEAINNDVDGAVQVPVPAGTCTLGRCLDACLVFMNPPFQYWCSGCCTCNCRKL
jgi:hypothetical protein